ncbi:DUF2085 domain-containing protein [Candidatus Dojkabacteria bacterium]|nr:DUF2085 domain-containing protein [Candidatus Dojkabacteria bacterium]
MEKLLNKLQENIFNSFIIFLILLNVLPFIAPIAAFLELHFISKSIYTIFSFTCHQFHWRSLHIFDYQVAWCTRDTFIWLGFLLTSLVMKFKLVKQGLPWYWIVPFTIPIALDGGIQTIATLVGFQSNEQFYLATNFTRMITGSIFGIGLGMIISSFLHEEQEVIRETLKPDSKSYTEILEQKKQSKEIDYKKLLINISSIFAVLLFLYTFLILIWRLTSPKYPPKGFFDHKVRNAPNVQEWVYERNSHGDK